MRRFTQLYMELDAQTSTLAKVDALKRYFADAPPEDAAWALAVLMGRKLTRSINTRRLRDFCAEATGYPLWLINESYSVVGDLSETLALLLPDDNDAADEALHEVVENRLLPLRHMDEDAQKAAILDMWRTFDHDQRFLFHKLMSSAMRVGVSTKLVTRALAQVAGVEEAVMAHRLAGKWEPTAENFRQLLSGETGDADASRPYPMYLAYQLDVDVEELGDIGDWQAEWKWDGIRGQLIKREGRVYLWTRGDELVTDAYPEVVAAATPLPDGTALDGELLAWEDGKPLPFAMLQRRLGRKHVQASLFPDVPVTFMAYDLLEEAGRDIRDRPLTDRRAKLEAVMRKAPDLELSPLIDAASWDELAALVKDARDRRVEGVMLKRKASVYGVGRQRGFWWKWKADPYTIDAVLVQGEQGSGRRAGLLTSYTFAVWDGEQLVPVTKAYSGLTNDEIEQVDRWIRNHTVSRHGPVRVVEPKLVFEIAFEGLQSSNRHKSGVAFRFPRMNRWRQDKPADEADTLESVHALLRSVEQVT